MSGRMRSVTIPCAAPGCRERAFYEVRTAKEGIELRSKEWRCLRHSSPESVLMPTRRGTRQVLVLTDKGHGRFWIPEGGVTGSGFASGPGFMAFEKDFPTGSRLIVEAKVAPPLAAPSGPEPVKARRGEDLNDPERCKNCGHSKAQHFDLNAYVPGKCNFQYDLCGCRDYEPAVAAPSGEPHDANKRVREAGRRPPSDPVWDSWFERHPDHSRYGHMIAHPVGCSRKCLSDAPSGERDAGPQEKS